METRRAVVVWFKRFKSATKLSGGLEGEGSLSNGASGNLVRGHLLSGVDPIEYSILVLFVTQHRMQLSRARSPVKTAQGRFHVMRRFILCFTYSTTLSSPSRWSSIATSEGNHDAIYPHTQSLSERHSRGCRPQQPSKLPVFPRQPRPIRQCKENKFHTPRYAWVWKVINNRKTREESGITAVNNSIVCMYSCSTTEPYP